MAFVTALSTNRQRASADAASGGLLAAGIAEAHSNSNVTTTAHIGAGANISGDALWVSASGHDDNFAYTNAGSGGLIAGAASIAHTNSTSIKAYIDGSAGSPSTITLLNGSGSFLLYADHIATFNEIISTNAGGLFAGAGGDVDNEVSANTEADIGAGAHVTAKSISITATNKADKPQLGGDYNNPQPNVSGTTGGLASGAGANDVTNVKFTTLVNIGDSDDLEVPGQPNNNHNFLIQAHNDLQMTDKLVFTTGGAVSGADVHGDIVVQTDIAHVTIGTNVTMFSAGAIDMDVSGTANVQELIETDVYGAGTATFGEATVDIRPDNQIQILGPALITA